MQKTRPCSHKLQFLIRRDHRGEFDLPEATTRRSAVGLIAGLFATWICLHGTSQTVLSYHGNPDRSGNFIVPNLGQGSIIAHGRWLSRARLICSIATITAMLHPHLRGAGGFVIDKLRGQFKLDVRHGRPGFKQRNKILREPCRRSNHTVKDRCGRQALLRCCVAVGRWPSVVVLGPGFVRGRAGPQLLRH
jgi:hypothetical protein